MKLAGRGVGEHQQQVIAQLVGEQTGRRIDLALAHAVGALNVQGHVHNAYAVQHSEALGAFWQLDVGGRADQAHLA